MEAMPETMEDEEPRLTDEQRARQEDWLRAHPYGEQDENGIDLSLLRRNLRLTPTERYRNHQRALRLALEIRRAGERAGIR